MNKEEVKFSAEQIECLKEIMQDEVATLMKEEIQQNYIPRIMVEGMLEKLKEHKQKCDIKFRQLYVDGAMWALQEVLNYKFERIDENE